MSESEMSARFHMFDIAAKKSDRWWFLALLMIGLMYVAYERYESNAERKQLREEIGQVRTEHAEYLEKRTEILTTALANNTHALEANTRLFERIESKRMLE